MIRLLILIFIFALSCTSNIRSNEISIGMNYDVAEKILEKHCSKYYTFAATNNGQTGTAKLPMLDDDTCVNLLFSEEQPNIVENIILRHGIGKPVGQHEDEYVKSIKFTKKGICITH